MFTGRAIFSIINIGRDLLSFIHPVSLSLSYTENVRNKNQWSHIYTTKIDGVVCPPNISETVAGKTHETRTSSTYCLDNDKTH